MQNDSRDVCGLPKPEYLAKGMSFLILSLCMCFSLCNPEEDAEEDAEVDTEEDAEDGAEEDAEGDTEEDGEEDAEEDAEGDAEEDAEEDAEGDAEDGTEEDAEEDPEEDAEENLTRLCFALLTLFFLFSCAVTSADIGRRDLTFHSSTKAGRTIIAMLLYACLFCFPFFVSLQTYQKFDLCRGDDGSTRQRRNDKSTV